MNDNYSKNIFIITVVILIAISIMLGLIIGQSIVHVHFVIEEDNLKNLLILYNIKL